MSYCYWFSSGLLAIVLSAPVQAEAWRADLKGGGAVVVNPQTHKPILNKDATTTQLWNGVHKLEDGSVIIVRDGVVVPNPTMYHAWATPPTPKAKQSSCAQLTLRVCGLKNSCADNQACELARQLQRLNEDVPENTLPGVTSNDQIDCSHGLLNPVTFPPCIQDTPPPAVCARLVTTTCGTHAECKAAPACNAAQQLLSLEQEANLNSLADTQSGQNCWDALSNAFFVVCAKK